MVDSYTVETGLSRNTGCSAGGTGAAGGSCLVIVVDHSCCGFWCGLDHCCR